MVQIGTVRVVENGATLILTWCEEAMPATEDTVAACSAQAHNRVTIWRRVTFLKLLWHLWLPQCAHWAHSCIASGPSTNANLLL